MAGGRVPECAFEIPEAKFCPTAQDRNKKPVECVLCLKASTQTNSGNFPSWPEFQKQNPELAPPQAAKIYLELLDQNPTS